MQDTRPYDGLLEFEVTRKQFPVVVAGGGIAGMYTALKLGEAGKQVILLEVSPDRWGGRIETTELDGFTAEFGPMRFEPELQPNFNRLMQDLGIEYLDFTGPVAEEIDYPKYDLLPKERNLSSLELLRRGIMLIMGKDPGDQAWIDSLKEEDYHRFRKVCKLQGKPLWEWGLWNALSSENILGHQALMKIRDTGTFYHLIPDNPNAIEWIIWWLRAMKTVGQQLVTIKGGSGRIIKQLMERLKQCRNIRMISGTRLLSFQDSREYSGTVEFLVQSGKRRLKGFAENLVLAMPRFPLKELAGSLPRNVASRLDSVNGFPMVKVFFVTKKPWWDRKQVPQQNANRMPTREVHYFRREEGADDDGHGMAMIYTDRPASEYWKVYVKDSETHDRAEIGANPELIHQFARWIAEELRIALCEESRPAGYLKLNKEARETFTGKTLLETEQMILDSVVTYGIRDWSRGPYGGANHCWNPRIKSWEVTSLFKAFSLSHEGPLNVHICGEAYSHYQGFIEGSLLSADLALETMLY